MEMALLVHVYSWKYCQKIPIPSLPTSLSSPPPPLSPPPLSPRDKLSRPLLNILFRNDSYSKFQVEIVLRSKYTVCCYNFCYRKRSKFAPL